ncbi:glutathione peroxidase [Aliifodinibius sp. S!AR15-10]|uniref:glutathione peroxidase n=1 Tax=Aliifodinibius sp. S!AR15-10 TaxID=2950437 RepID=UPI0038F61A62
MKTLSVLLVIVLMSVVATDKTADSVHDFELNDIEGEKISLKKFEGNVLLIVNTASECGFTPQYEGLQALYEEYEGKGLTILGFPANNFGGQEPGTDEEIKQFCSVNYGVNFPMFSKISVKGNDIHPLFDYLTSQDNPDFTGEIKWNFEKFLVSKEGKLLHRFRSKVTPKSDEIINAVDEALKM